MSHVSITVPWYTMRTKLEIFINLCNTSYNGPYKTSTLLSSLPTALICYTILSLILVLKCILLSVLPLGIWGPARKYEWVNLSKKGTEWSKETTFLTPVLHASKGILTLYQPVGLGLWISVPPQKMHICMHLIHPKRMGMKRIIIKW